MLASNHFNIRRGARESLQWHHLQPEMAPVSSSHPSHFVMFPFMSQGHITPLLSLARLLSTCHNVAVTFFTTPGNSPPISAYLSDTTISIISLPFPSNIPGMPPGIENSGELPSMTLFPAFASSTKLIKPYFDEALRALHPPADCIISDGFLGWTQRSAEELGIPRLVSYGMANYSMAICNILALERPHAAVTSHDEAFSVPNFPWVKLTKNDIDPPFDDRNPEGPFVDFVMEQAAATARSQGLVVNSFYELEPRFHDYLDRTGPRPWCLGPLCLVQRPKMRDPSNKPYWKQWLDKKLVERSRSILYVAFGTQAEVSPEQILEIAAGLEKSKKSFLWVLRSGMLTEILDGFEERVKDRGMVVKEWVDQMGVLEHESVTGFLSHCGWNSVTESICAGVPILAMPLMAEQHLNARMVVEEIGVGLRARPSNGTVRGIVRSEEVKRMVVELMDGARGEEVRKKVKAVKEAACASMEEGGSSDIALEQLLHEVRNKLM